MPTYITLLRWTQKGIEQVKDSAARYEGAKKLFESMGAEIKAIYLVMGQYDLVIVTEGPDDESLAKAALAAASRGFVRTESMRAFTEDEYRRIIADLP
ncbi:MAG: GYD domain-containing protein [Gemmatimonadota bacterium]